MNLIVNVDLDWGIGRAGDLLVHLPGDLKQFKRLTTGKIIVYGRKTLDTFPRQKPLPNRINIILTRHQTYKNGDAIICHDTTELADRLSNYPDESIFVIGGDSVYRQLFPFCSKAHVTRVFRRFNADAFFPDLDQETNWQKIATGPVLLDRSRTGNREDLIPFQHDLYQQKSVKNLRQHISTQEV